MWVGLVRGESLKVLRWGWGVWMEEESQSSGVPETDSSLNHSFALGDDGADWSPSEAGGWGEGGRDDDAASEYRVLPIPFVLHTLS